MRLTGAYLGGVSVSLQPLLVSAVALPATAYVIRALGPTQYGQWAIALTIVSLAMLLCNLGLRGTFVRALVREPDAEARLLAEQLGVRLALCVPASGVALAACVLLGYSRIVLLCTAIALVWMTLHIIATTASDLLQARHRLAAVAGVNAIYGLLLTATTVVAAHFGLGPLGVAASHTLAAVASVVLMLRVVAREGVELGISLEWRRAAGMLWEGRHFGVQLVVNNGAAQIEHVLVPRMTGPMLFGFFAAGALLAIRLQAIPDGAASAAYAAIADVDRASGRAAARRVFARFLLLSVSACVAASAAVSFLVEPISQLLFPEQAEICAQVMRVTIWSLPLAAIVSIFSSALNALGRDAQQARVALAASVCHFLLAAVLIWRFGIVGASWSIVLQEALWVFMLAPSVFTLFRSGVDDAADLKPRTANTN